MKRNKLPSQSDLRQLFDYVPDTGELRWKSRQANTSSKAGYVKSWNSRFAGKRAGSIHTLGYRKVRIYGKAYFCSRVIYKLFYGAEPEDVDHINGNTLDDRLVNLRGVTHRQNQRNMKLRSDSPLGYSGIRKENGKFVVRNWHNGKEKSSRFELLEDAVAFRQDFIDKNYMQEHGRHRCSTHGTGAN